MGRLRKIMTRWIHCSFQPHQIIPAGVCLACSHRQPEEKDGSKGNWGSKFYRINTWRGAVIPFTHKESLRKATAQWGLWCYHFSRFFLTVAFIDFRAIFHTCGKLTLSQHSQPPQALQHGLYKLTIFRCGDVSSCGQSPVIYITQHPRRRLAPRRPDVATNGFLHKPFTEEW